MTADDFATAVRAAPADDTPRLAYADWLDDRGDAARAEFIRVQCELAALDECDPRRPGLEDREHELLAEHERAWLDPGAKAWNEWEFRRGFVEMVSANTTALPTEYTRHTAPRDLTVTGHGPVLQTDDRRTDEIPLYPHAERIDFSGWDVSGPSADVVLTHRVWPRLHALNMSYRSGPTDPAAVLARAEFLPRLRELNVGGSPGSVSARALAALADKAPVEDLAVFDLGYETGDIAGLVAAYGPTLRHLDVSLNQLGSTRSFFTHPGFIQTLDISFTGSPPLHPESYLNKPLFRDLRRLTVGGFHATAGSLRVLADSPFWSRAESFRAPSGTFGERFQDPFFRTVGPPALRSLGLENNGFGPAGVRAVIAAPWARSLIFLDLTDNGLDDDVCRYLGEGPLPHLRTLHLSRNGAGIMATHDGVEAAITDRGALALGDSRNLQALRVLTVSDTAIGGLGVFWILGTGCLPLSGFGAAGLNLQPDAIPTIASFQTLRRLTWLDLSRNPALGGAALMPLAESEYLSPLCELDLTDIDVDPKVRDAFLQRLGPRLTCDAGTPPMFQEL